jgi:predicted ATPase
MHSIHNPNFYLFTGGPGAGKTTVLEELKQQGHLVIAEAARDIIKNQQAIGGNATHTGNRIEYCDLMLKKSIADYTKMVPVTERIIFFDRGIPDLYSYSERFCSGVTSEIIEAVKITIAITRRHSSSLHGLRFIAMILRENRILMKQ